MVALATLFRRATMAWWFATMMIIKRSKIWTPALEKTNLVRPHSVDRKSRFSISKERFRCPSHPGRKIHRIGCFRTCWYINKGIIPATIDTVLVQELGDTDSAGNVSTLPIDDFTNYHLMDHLSFDIPKFLSTNNFKKRSLCPWVLIPATSKCFFSSPLRW